MPVSYTHLGFYQVVFDGRIDCLHEWKKVEAYFIAGVFIFQIRAVGYVFLLDTLKVVNDFFPINTK